MFWIDPPSVIDAHGRHAQAVRFTRDGQLLLSVGLDKMVRLWSVPGFEPVGAFEGHANSVNTISLSPDERSLATASSDGTVRVWTMPEGETIQVLQKQGQAVFSNSGRLLATLSRSGRAKLWDTGSWETVSTLPKADNRSFSLAFAPDDLTLLVGGSGPIHMYSIPDGDPLGQLEGHAIAVPSLLFHPSGAVLASTGTDAMLRFWSTTDWTEAGRVPIGSKGVYSLAFAPDGNSLAVSAHNKILLVDVSSGNILQEIALPVRGVYGVNISADGQFLANAAADGKIRVWQGRQQ